MDLGLRSSLSPAFHKYLEDFTALHSVAAQAEGARAHWVACGKGIRREHPARRSGPPSDPMEENPCKPELHASQGLNP